MMPGLPSIAAWLVAIAPLLGVIVAKRRFIEGLALVSAASSLVLWVDAKQSGQAIERPLWTWLELPTVRVAFHCLADAWSLLCLLLATLVVLVIVATTTGLRPPRWLMLSWWGVTLAATSGDLGQWFIGWLVSAWGASELARAPRESAIGSVLSRPVWLLQRVSDAALLIGVGLIWLHFDSLSWGLLSADVLSRERSELLEGIALCLFIGVIGRCAQLPLTVWLETESGFAARTNRSMVRLSDEMVGLWNVPAGHQVAERLKSDPTNRWHVVGDGSIPATVWTWWLCAAFLPLGSLLMLRAESLFAAAPQTRLLSVAVGAFTLLVCSASAAAQMNWPRVLGQLAAGQCGFVLVSLSVDSQAAASVLFFQSLLLAVLLLASDGTRRESGLVFIAALLLASGVWGRHVLVDEVWQTALPASSTNLTDAVLTEAAGDQVVLGTTRSRLMPLVFGILCLGELLLGFALLRAVLLSRRVPDEVPATREDTRRRTLWLTGLLAISVGIGTYLVPLGIGDLLPLSAAGVVLAWWMYSTPSSLPERISAALGPFARLSRNRFYWDDLYFLLFVQPVTAFLTRVTWFDGRVWQRGRAALRNKFAQGVGLFCEPLLDGRWSIYGLTMLSSIAVLAWMLLWLKP